jgi:hypothetical protein
MGPDDIDLLAASEDIDRDLLEGGVLGGIAVRLSVRWREGVTPALSK